MKSVAAHIGHPVLTQPLARSAAAIQGVTRLDQDQGEGAEWMCGVPPDLARQAR